MAIVVEFTVIIRVETAGPGYKNEESDTEGRRHNPNDCAGGSLRLLLPNHDLVVAYGECVLRAGLFQNAAAEAAVAGV
ncbi:hypothetical protein Lal_00036696 [Lupinus albus]|nr:hypothetical protein Lal_00036696 [Lupinus albus]